MEAEAESARSYIEKLFFNTKKYDLGNVGRYKINYKLGLNIDPHITISDTRRHSIALSTISETL